MAGGGDGTSKEKLAARKFSPARLAGVDVESSIIEAARVSLLQLDE
jgi:trans-aconitate methyltransferase